MTTVIIFPQKRAIRLLIKYLTVRFDMWNSLVVSTWGAKQPTTSFSDIFLPTDVANMPNSRLESFC